MFSLLQNYAASPVERPRASRKSFSIYKLGSESNDEDGSKHKPVKSNPEQLSSFINRISATVVGERKPLRVSYKPADEDFAVLTSSQASQIIKDLEEALKQERKISDSLRQRVVELETTKKMTHLDTSSLHDLHPRFESSQMFPDRLSDWRIRMEQIQKSQFDKIMRS